MIPNEILQMLHQLLSVTREGRAVWRLENGVYSIALTPQVSVSVQDQGRRYSVKIRANENDVIGEFFIEAGEDNFYVVDDLFREAGKTFGTKVYRQIMGALTSGGIIGQTTPTTLPPQPPQSVLPPNPTEQQEKDFFSRIEGHWIFDSSQGTEDIQIDAAGSYFRAKSAGAIFMGGPTYKLSLLACNDDLSKVEMAKNTFDGRIAQIEVLNVSHYVIEGIAKHDNHRLVYTRRGVQQITDVRVTQEKGQWSVHTPGGDRYPFPNEGQARAFAHGFRIFFDEKAGSGPIRHAISDLERNQLNIDLKRRLQIKLDDVIKKEA